MPTSYWKFILYGMILGGMVVLMSYAKLVASDNIDSALSTEPISDIPSLGSLRAEVNEQGQLADIETLDVDEVDKKLPMKIAMTQKSNAHDIHVTYVYVDNNKQPVNSDDLNARSSIRGVQYKIDYINRGNKVYEEDGKVKNTMEIMWKQNILNGR